MKILAIETSHDDTSVALYENRKIIKEKTISQTKFHSQFGGTLPEYASRIHAQNLPIILREFLDEFSLEDIDHIAVTTEPGLIGSLHMGKLFAHAIGIALNKPVRNINHMHAHIYATCFNHDIIYPALALIVSGGHTQLWDVKGPRDITLLGQTTDDAAGEVFDKVSRALGLGFPGGPAIEKKSKEATEFVDFSLQHERNFNFSFSGLKTKVINYIHNHEQKGEVINVASVAKGFQNAIVENLIFKTKYAIEVMNPASIILGGGVAANTLLREEFAKLHSTPLIPEKMYTTDNAAMIAIMSDFLEKDSQ